jgi:hypothetical protein
MATGASAVECWPPHWMRPLHPPPMLRVILDRCIAMPCAHLVATLCTNQCESDKHNSNNITCNTPEGPRNAARPARPARHPTNTNTAVTATLTLTLPLSLSPLDLPLPLYSTCPSMLLVDEPSTTAVVSTVALVLAAASQV